MFVPQNRAEKKLHELWLRFLTEINENTEEVSKELLENELIREALGYMEKAAYTKEQLAQYDKWKVDLMSAQSMIDDAETRGVTIGLEKGEAIGLEKGRVEGEAIGERNKTLKNAKNALKMGLSEEEVINFTGLTKEEIMSLI